MEFKKLTVHLYLKEGCARTGAGEGLLTEAEVLRLVKAYSDNGLDQLYLTDLSESDEEHEENIGLIRKIGRVIDIPMLAGGSIRRVEDVKKLLYAGAERAVLDFSDPGNIKLLDDVFQRFGSAKLAVALPDIDTLFKQNAEIEGRAGLLIFHHRPDLSSVRAITSMDCLIEDKYVTADEVPKLLAKDHVAGVDAYFLHNPDADYMGIKHTCKEQGIPVDTFESALPFETFKLNGDGLIPVVVQDYKSNEVLMAAYMNQESYDKTIRTGRMTYYSRSRQELWLKGETSGHYQYVKSLSIDCDKDTILAKVYQVGAACHTGNRSCFFTPLTSREVKGESPLQVFEEVYGTIIDRQQHPKEGSYTNYLLDKGIDKVLKKVGEEVTEIVIAAKNPDPEEIKYEMSDFLYHAMVLMVQKGITWEDIIQELAHRK